MEANLSILWKSYKRKEDLYFRDKLVANYRPFLKSVVNHVHSRLPRTVDIMDLENYAYIGLLDAIKKFDLERNIKFETYASYRIKGAIIDGIRKQDWLSRTMRAKCRVSEGYIESFEGENQDFQKDCHYDHNGNFNDAIDASGFACVSEDSEALSTAEPALQPVSEKGTVSGRVDLSFEKFYMYSIDDPAFYEKKAEENSDSIESIYDLYALNNTNFAEKLENKLLLKKILEKLNRQEKRIVFLYYFKGKTFREIGKMLDITESRVSQINKQILLTLKRAIKSASLAVA